MLLEKPTQVKIAVTLIYCTLGIALLRTLFSSPLEKTPFKAMLVISIIAFYSFFIFLITRIANGRNWARQLYVVLFVIGLPGSLPFYWQEFSTNPWVGGIGFLVVGLQATAVYLLYTKEAKNWFRQLSESDSSQKTVAS